MCLTFLFSPLGSMLLHGPWVFSGNVIKRKRSRVQVGAKPQTKAEGKAGFRSCFSAFHEPPRGVKMSQNALFIMAAPSCRRVCKQL